MSAISTTRTSPARARHINFDRIAMEAAFDFQGATTMTQLGEAAVHAAMRVSPGELLYIQAFHNTLGKVDAITPNIEWPFNPAEQSACARLFLDHPFVRAFPKMEQSPYTIADIMPERRWREEPIYREVFARNRFAHQQTLAMAATPEVNYALVAMRSGMGFTSREDQGIKRIWWQLLPAMRRVLMIEQLNAERRLLESAVDQSRVALIALNAEGCLARMNSVAGRLLRSHDPAGTPGAIMMELRLQRAFAATAEGWTVSTPEGALRFRPAPALAPGETLLYVEEVERRNPDGRYVMLGLTPRQDAVLHWMVWGKSDREIAVLLTLGLRTVHEQVRQIFDALGVDNRYAAARVARTIGPAALVGESSEPAFLEALT